MGWATAHIAVLSEGRTVRFRPHGNSMRGRVASGDLVQVAPCRADPVKGDVVLCTVNGAHYLHLVTAVQNGRFQISNNKRHVNGWTGRDNIYGILEAVNPTGELPMVAFERSP